jgi:lipid A 3-O-deacylase
LQGCDEDCAKRVGAKGLRDDGQPQVAGTLHHGGLTQPRDEDDLYEGGAAPDHLHHFPAAPGGHDDIEDDKIPPSLIEARQSAHGIGGGLAIVPERHEQACQNLAYIGIVVDQEHPGPMHFRHDDSRALQSYRARNRPERGEIPQGQRMITDIVRRWLIPGLVAVVAFGPTTARAQSIQAGTLEWTLAVGGGASLPDEDRRLETVTSVHLLPHVGYFVTGEIGGGTLRGNFELLVEPTLIYLDASNSATVVGVAVLPRWLFAAFPRVRPYLEMGGGVLAGQIDLRQTNCDVNFVLEGGAGAMIFVAERVALTLGVRLHHVSNANRCSENEGINSVIGIAGISYFTR